MTDIIKSIIKFFFDWIMPFGLGALIFFKGAEYEYERSINDRAHEIASFIVFLQDQDRDLQIDGTTYKVIKVESHD